MMSFNLVKLPKEQLQNLLAHEHQLVMAAVRAILHQGSRGILDETAERLREIIKIDQSW